MESIRFKVTETEEDIGRRALATPSPLPHVLGSQALLDVATERARQVKVEGFDALNDDQYAPDTLAAAGVAYALTENERQLKAQNGFQFWRIIWPFEKAWFKSTSRRRDLVKAAALIVAEIERLDRAALSSPREGAE